MREAADSNFSWNDMTEVTYFLASNLAMVSSCKRSGSKWEVLEGYFLSAVNWCGSNLTCRHSVSIGCILFIILLQQICVSYCFPCLML